MGVTSGYQIVSGSLLATCTANVFVTGSPIADILCFYSQYNAGYSYSCDRGYYIHNTQCTTTLAYGWTIAPGFINSQLTQVCQSNGVFTVIPYNQPPCTSLTTSPSAGIGIGSCAGEAQFGAISSLSTCTLTLNPGWTLSPTSQLLVTCAGSGSLVFAPTTGPTAYPPCNSPVVPTGFSIGTCGGTDLPGSVNGNSVCYLSLLTGWSIASGSTTGTCGTDGTFQFLSGIPTAFAPCNSPTPPVGFTAGTCTGVISSTQSCSLSLIPGYTLSTSPSSVTATCTNGILFSQLPQVLPICYLAPFLTALTDAGQSVGTCTVALPAGSTCLATCTIPHYTLSGPTTCYSNLTFIPPTCLPITERYINVGGITIVADPVTGWLDVGGNGPPDYAQRTVQFNSYARDGSTLNPPISYPWSGTNNGAGVTLLGGASGQWYNQDQFWFLLPGTVLTGGAYGNIPGWPVVIWGFSSQCKNRQARVLSICCVASLLSLILCPCYCVCSV